MVVPITPPLSSPPRSAAAMGPGGLLWGRGGRRALSRGAAAGAPRSVQPYEAIPRSGRSRWLNLYRFWRSNGFQHFHRLMESNFQRLGPIYRWGRGVLGYVLGGGRRPQPGTPQ
uniref:Uncharacterized protein n=1 Tax=Cairina moschata TaxID=8855 RepID=A0A8C3CPL2_CAIMO